MELGGDLVNSTEHGLQPSLWKSGLLEHAPSNLQDSQKTPTNGPFKAMTVDLLLLQNLFWKLQQ